MLAYEHRVLIKRFTSEILQQKLGLHNRGRVSVDLAPTAMKRKDNTWKHVFSLSLLMAYEHRLLTKRFTSEILEQELRLHNIGKVTINLARNCNIKEREYWEKCIISVALDGL